MRVPVHASRPATCSSNSSCITTPHQVLERYCTSSMSPMETAARCNQTESLHLNFHTAVSQPTAPLRYPSARAAPQLPRHLCPSCRKQVCPCRCHASSHTCVGAWHTAMPCRLSHAAAHLLRPYLLPAHPGVISAAQPFTRPTGGQAHAGVQRPLGSTGQAVMTSSPARRVATSQDTKALLCMYTRLPDIEINQKSMHV